MSSCPHLPANPGQSVLVVCPDIGVASVTLATVLDLFGSGCIIKASTIVSLPVKARKIMKYTRVLIARVALGVASEDEVFWVDRCCKEKAGCTEAVNDLRELAKIESAGYCIDPSTLISIGDTHKTSDEESNHLMECHRCARVGQYIANMPNPGDAQRHVPLSLRAG